MRIFLKETIFWENGPFTFNTNLLDSILLDFLIFIYGCEAQPVFKITVGFLRRSEFRDVEGQGTVWSNLDTNLFYIFVLQLLWRGKRA